MPTSMHDLGEAIVRAVLSALEETSNDGWAFDGFRRVYTDGKPSAWRARMVDTSSESGSVRYIEGRGTTMHEAIVDMGDRRKALP